MYKRELVGINASRSNWNVFPAKFLHIYSEIYMYVKCTPEPYLNRTIHSTHNLHFQMCIHIQGVNECLLTDLIFQFVWGAKAELKVPRFYNVAVLYFRCRIQRLPFSFTHFICIILCELCELINHGGFISVRKKNIFISIRYVSFQGNAKWCLYVFRFFSKWETFMQNHIEKNPHLHTYICIHNLRWKISLRWEYFLFKFIGFGSIHFNRKKKSKFIMKSPAKKKQKNCFPW